MSKETYVGSIKSLLELKSIPCSKIFGRLTVEKNIDGSLIEIPFAVIRGKESKPTMWLQGSVHADEVAGIAAIRRIINDLEPEKLCGTVIAIPIINTTAYSAQKRHSPIDNKDLYLSFAARDPKSFTERLAGLLLKELTSLLTDDDFLFDLHGSPGGCIMQPWIAYQGTGDISEVKSLRAAEAAGIRVVWKNIAHMDYNNKLGESTIFSDEAIAVGSFPTELLKKRKLGRLVIESGSSFALEEDVQLQYNAVMNVMKHLNMLKGQIVELAEEQIFINDTRRAMTTRRGFWRPIELPGKMVTKNQKLAIVTDEYGNKIEIIKSSVDGILLINKLSSFVDPLSDVLSYRYGAFIGIEGR